MDIKSYNGMHLVSSIKEELKNYEECKMPDWANFVKTGVGKQRPPSQNDWWYGRSASILRKIAILGPLGVNKLKRKYGCNKNNGYAPTHFQKGSGKIIRTIIQQLEKAGLVKQVVISGHKGRVLDTKGTQLIAKAAKSLREQGKSSEGGEE
ncbi:MAG: 30S ribosomal protein S19e [Nanobdellota archaeon]